jgi:hypothetical protein
MARCPSSKPPVDARSAAAHSAHSSLTLPIALATVALLAGCGGGGSSGIPSTPPPSATNPHAALTTLFRQPRSFTLAGSTSTGVQLTGMLSIDQPSSRTYSGVSYDISNINLTVRNAGALAASNTVTIWFFGGTIEQLVLVTSSDGRCGWSTSGATVPKVAALGQSGAYTLMTTYQSCDPPVSRSVISRGTRTQTWSYELVDGIPMVCVNSTLREFYTTTESDCIEVTDSAGTLGSRVSVVTTDINSVTTRLKNY